MSTPRTSPRDMTKTVSWDPHSPASTHMNHRVPRAQAIHLDLGAGDTRPHGVVPVLLQSLHATQDAPSRGAWPPSLGLRCKSSQGGRVWVGTRRRRGGVSEAISGRPLQGRAGTRSAVDQCPSAVLTTVRAPATAVPHFSLRSGQPEERKEARGPRAHVQAMDTGTAGWVSGQTKTQYKNQVQREPDNPDQVDRFQETQPYRGFSEGPGKPH